MRDSHPLSFILFIFTTGLEQAIQEDLKDVFRPSVHSVSSHGKKFVNSNKNGQVVVMGKAIRYLQIKEKLLLLHAETLITASLLKT